MRATIHTRRILRGALPASLLYVLAFHAHAQYDVTQAGSFSPPEQLINFAPPGFPPNITSVKNEYQLVRSAVLDPSLSQLLIEPGVYRESGVYNTPAVLTTDAGETVTIGTIDAGDSTTFSLATLNVHIGGGTFIPSWQDVARTQRIASICAQKQWDNVAFTEMWDEDYFCLSCCPDCGPQSGLPVPLMELAGYPYGAVGDDNDGDPQQSGLATMSKHQFSGIFFQGSFTDCSGSNPFDPQDCFANKGWIRTRINKGGIGVQVINTHMQADLDGTVESVVRKAQMTQLRNWILFERTIPGRQGDIFFIVGDFNVPGDKTDNQYYVDMAETFFDFNDAVRNAPGFVASQQRTNSASNPLALCFDCDTGENRYDYILYTPESFDGTVKATPRSAGRFQFIGSSSLTDDCDECPDGDLTTNQLSDHWGVEAEFELYRP